MQEIKQQLIDLRITLDLYINSIYLLRNSREVSLAYTNLQRGKMWLGKCLGELGSQTPYPQAENPQSAVIEPQAEHFNYTLEALWNNGQIPITQTARVKNMRHYLEELVVQPTKEIVTAKRNQETIVSEFFTLYLLNALFAVEEAKMWLGWELDRIRKENNQEPTVINYRTEAELPLI